MNARLFGAALAALTALAAAPAAAHVNGIGVVDLPFVVAGAQARVTAYQQIGAAFEPQRGQLEGLQQQREGLVRPFDTNNDGQLNEEENTAFQANATIRQQVEAVQQQINAIQNPVQLSSIYVLEQIGEQLNVAVQQVIQAENIQVILSPESVVYAAPATDLTAKIIAQLNQILPTVQTTPPQGWQPSQQGVGLFQQVQQILAMAQQQAAAQAQQPAAQPVQGR